MFCDNTQEKSYSKVWQSVAILSYFTTKYQMQSFQEYDFCSDIKLVIISDVIPKLYTLWKVLSSKFKRMTVHSLIAELVGIHKNYLKNYYNIHESKFSSINNLPIKCKFVNFYQTNLQVIATAVFKDNTGVPPIILKRIFKIQVDENYSLPIQKFLHYATEFMGPGI